MPLDFSLDFRRETIVTPAFDRRDPNPSKNYGIHGMDLRFTLVGPRGAVFLVVFTPMHLPHVAAELWDAEKRDYNPFVTRGAYLGYHSPTPMYDGQEPRETACEYLGGRPCYADSSCLRAHEFTDTFLSGGSDAVWAMLEREYTMQFHASEPAEG